LAHLPVTILSGPLESGVDGGALEGRQGDDGSPADRGTIVLGSQDGVKPPIVADGTQGGDGGLATERVVVLGRDSG
jgi:hypothetical protein